MRNVKVICCTLCAQNSNKSSNIGSSGRVDLLASAAPRFSVCLHAMGKWRTKSPVAKCNIGSFAYGLFGCVNMCQAFGFYVVV